VARIGAWCSDEEHFTAETERRRRAWESLLANESDWFPPHLIAMYETILQQLMHLWQTYTQPRLAAFSHLTLTHGDAYLANFLCPHEGQSGATYLIDWQSPEVYRGASDLVNMCATFWTRQQRAEGQREVKVLQQYHRTLQQNGVTGYAWDDLVRDYRYSIVDWLLVPLQDRLEGSSKAYWWPKMQCLAHAFEDWNCADLFVQS
jgi:thiamine kinase-like enzyme